MEYSQSSLACYLASILVHSAVTCSETISDYAQVAVGFVSDALLPQHLNTFMEHVLGRMSENSPEDRSEESGSLILTSRMTQ